jgi:GNAT superfamily N-acetyltransferase
MPAVYLRKATKEDLPKVIDIITEAKAYLKKQDIDQWQGNYPSNDDLAKDISNDITYVLMVDDQIAGTAALWRGIDLNYLKLEGGSWINGIEARYTAIHRIAVSSDFRGQHLSDRLISGLLTVSRTLGFVDVRIDTHPDNKGMQHVITNNGFDYRGVIYMNVDNEDSKRFAYQIIMK